MILYMSRVQLGAELLDDEVEDWYNRIDTERLDCTDWLHCVLGQLYEIYTDGLRALNLPTADLELEYGFDSWDDKDLTPFWLEEIARRKLSNGH